jgi:beta-lactamase regulating signal transducer with metallopeptidase domain
MSHFEERLAATLLSVLFSASIRAAVLGGLTWVMLKVVRAKAAAVRHAAWTAVLLAMLLMPFLRTALPPFRLPLLPFSTTQSTQVQPMHRASNLVGATMSAGDSARGRLFQTEPRSIMSRWPVMILALYAAGALFLLLRQSIGYLVAGRLVRSSQLLGTTDVVTLKHRLPSGVQIPDLRRSSLVRVPIVVGVLKPSIILPADWSAWKEEKLAAVVAHELSHVQRCDTLVRFLSTFNKCLYWFHPLAWWLDRHLSELAEQVSDDSALTAVPDRRKYVEVLLGFAATASKGAGRIRWAGLAMATTSHLGVRIERILSGREAAADRLARRTLVLLLIAAPLAAVSTATIEITSAQQMPSSKSDSVLSTGSVRPQSFAGTWQGVWHDTWMGSQTSISIALNVKVADGRLSGATTSTVQKQPLLQKQNPAPSPGTLPPQLAPPPPPPPPPPPTPPAGTMLDPRVEGHTLVFKVKASDAKVVDFQLTLQASDTGTLKVTFPTHWQSDFEMKKAQ